MAEKKGNKKKQVGNGSSNNNSSFTNDLFGPKDPPSPSSSTLFGSVFGPPYSTRKQDFGGHYDNGKHGISGSNTYRGKGEISGSTNSNKFQSQTVEPSNLSSSLYYGGQEVYSQTSQTNASQSVFKRDGIDGDDDDDSNGSDSASRGNWWKGSLYY